MSVKLYDRLSDTREFCDGVTHEGQPCRNIPKSGEKFCAQHMPVEEGKFLDGTSRHLQDLEVDIRCLLCDSRNYDPDEGCWDCS